jgi:hypothetical protein
MGNEKLTTLAKRIRPYIKFQAAELAATVGKWIKTRK